MLGICALQILERTLIFTVGYNVTVVLFLKNHHYWWIVEWGDYKNLPFTHTAVIVHSVKEWFIGLWFCCGLYVLAGIAQSV